VTQHERPEFGRRREEVNESAFVAKNLRPEMLPNPVGVLKESKPVLEVGSGRDLYGAHGVVALIDDHGVAVGDETVEGDFFRRVERNYHGHNGAFITLEIGGWKRKSGGEWRKAAEENRDSTSTLGTVFGLQSRAVEGSDPDGLITIH
jgi:hypothetical protein